MTRGVRHDPAASGTGRIQAARGDKPDAIGRSKAALKFERKGTPTDVREHEAAVRALAALR
jgi:hypothetical protein